jgi:hypothetical protein
LAEFLIILSFQSNAQVGPKLGVKMSKKLQKSAEIDHF